MMGRFGLVSLGHGGFMGLGAYVTGAVVEPPRRVAVAGHSMAMIAAAVLAVIVAYPCFRFRITGHYFVLVTLALSGIVLQVITATRDYTGGSLVLHARPDQGQPSDGAGSSTTRSPGI